MERRLTRKESLRGAVMTHWQQSGKPPWTLTETAAACKDADEVLERAGFTPAPMFRAARLIRNQPYLNQWAWGCRFPWLWNG